MWIVIKIYIVQFPINLHILPHCGENMVIKMADSIKHKDYYFYIILPKKVTNLFYNFEKHVWCIYWLKIFLFC